MLSSLDLSHRQAARVLEQALRTRARLEIEPRSRTAPLTGTLTGHQNGLLYVDLHDHGGQSALTGLVGSFCDVATTLSGNLYRFASCIVEAMDNAIPHRLVLAIPELVQLDNRRRYDRLAPAEPVVLQIAVAGTAQPLSGTLNQVSRNGLSCRVPRREADEFLLIDDPVHVRFRLPGDPETLDLQAIVCSKSATTDADSLDLGLEFQSTPQTSRAMERLHAALARACGFSAEGDQP